MQRIAVFVALFVCLAATAAAQTEGWVSVGGSITFVQPTDSDVQSLIGGGPLVRLNPKKGWGIAGGLSWFRANVDNPEGGDAPFARLRIRPLMGGVSYTVGEQPVLVSFSIVAGPSFNDLDFRDAYLDSLPPDSGRPELDIENSFAVRPGVNITWTVAPRVAIIGFGGYMYNEPDVIYRDSSGQEFRNRWKGNAILLSIGAVYSLF
ncbi:MAG TPA: outer membrane beta-barrel protein [Vicinamibacterales bacterium]|nr:outer membrane beta-barrel protein [Vicinamibacterales bacterium]